MHWCYTVAYINYIKFVTVDEVITFVANMMETYTLLNVTPVITYTTPF